MTTTPDFRALCAELFDQLFAYEECNDEEEVSEHWNYTNCNELLHSARTALATPPPEPTTSQITFNDSPTEEVIRLDKEGFHYKGQFIADAGEAHRLMLVFLKQHAKAEPEPLTEDELNALWTIYDGIVDLRDFVVVARAVLERWGGNYPEIPDSSIHTPLPHP
jgi:hypothetical protein